MCSSEETVRDMLRSDKSALEKHVSRFVGRDGFFSPSTVTDGLDKIHSKGALIKGPLIAIFNSSHSGSKCPFLATEFKKDERSGYAKYLHLGTTRIWNSDGSINEERWQQFCIFILKDHPDGKIFVTKSKMQAYLEHCKTTDPQEFETGRNTSALFSSASAQVFAATSAWDEVYERLTCGWVHNELLHDNEPYIDLDLIRLFFEDSNAAFLRAELRELPVAKPVVTRSVVPAS